MLLILYSTLAQIIYLLILKKYYYQNKNSNDLGRLVRHPSLNVVVFKELQQ
jgi:hypothetical protein